MTYLNQISSHVLQSGQKALEAREMKRSRWSNLSEANFLSCLRRKSVRTDVLSSYDNYDDDDEDNDEYNDETRWICVIIKIIK